MLVSDPISSSSPISCAADFIAALPASRLGVSEGAELALAAPIARYRITADGLRRHASLEEVAYLWGWRFFVVESDRMLPRAIDVRPGRDAGSWRAGLVAGGHLARQLRLIDHLSRSKTTGTVRVLDAPGLDWSGLWLAGEGAALISQKSTRPISAGGLLSRLRRTEARQSKGTDKARGLSG